MFFIFGSLGSLGDSPPLCIFFVLFVTLSNITIIEAFVIFLLQPNILCLAAVNCT